MSRRTGTAAFSAALAITATLLPLGGSAASPPTPDGTKNIPVRATFEVHQDQRSGRPLARGAIHGVRRVEGNTFSSTEQPSSTASDIALVSPSGKGAGVRPAVRAQ